MSNKDIVWQSGNLHVALLSVGRLLFFHLCNDWVKFALLKTLTANVTLWAIMNLFFLRCLKLWTALPKRYNPRLRSLVSIGEWIRLAYTFHLSGWRLWVAKCYSCGYCSIIRTLNALCQWFCFAQKYLFRLVNCVSQFLCPK